MASANRFQFSSQEFHAATGMSMYLFRGYVPSLQRWGNEDPIEEYGGINLYGLVWNDPQNWLDTDGLLGWRLEFGHGGWHFQLGDSRWDAQTLEPVAHLGETPPALTADQIDEIRRSGLLDKARKMFPEGRIARAVADSGLAGKLLKLSKPLAKPLCRVLGRAAPPLIVAGALSDLNAIGQTAATGIGAAKSATDAANSTLDTHINSNRHLFDDDPTDGDLTRWLGKRLK